jgi:hypothetical protein
MRRLGLLLLAIGAVPAAAGAFRDTGPTRCFAIAEPPPNTSGVGGWAAVASWPARRLRAQVSVRLSRGHLPGSPVTLTVGDTAFPLVAGTDLAWARDRLEDARVVAAMRSGSSMSVSAVSPARRPYADVYRLHGAASAIDAAMLACPLD